MTERFSSALAYANDLHRHQRRKGSAVPYVSHLLSVAALVMEAGGSEDECIAALLHDAVEDQGGAGTADEIRHRFGAEVARIVEACSEDKGAGRTWTERKRSAVSKVAGMDASARLVLTADKLHNIRSVVSEHAKIGDAVWWRFGGGREGTLWYYRAMADAIAGAGGSRLLRELRAAVDNLEALAD
ncbi:MAG: HD domain-containing protein [Acidobacteriia bacterium]|nr:HD domain-containing protein [Terriglobia bacterium]MYG04249.1 HD domain-containing protein [Terriglobia bacterium]MYK11383.1 HD domain-containing protein [Terriglobia bacterium]